MTEARIQLEGCGCDDQAPASLWWRIGGSAFLAMNAMVLSISINGSSEVTAEERFMLELSILCLTIPVFFLLSFEFLEATWRAIRRFRLSIELLFLIGIAACLGASLIYFIKRTGNGYADVAAMLLVIYALGRQIGGYGKQRVLSSLKELSPQNRQARLLSGELVTASDVQPGDEIRVLPGEAVPVDLRLTVGAALLHEASITGESLAVRKQQGDLVKAGSFPLDCSIDGVAVSKGSETSLDEVRAMIESGLARPGAEQGLAIQALRWFVPLVLLVSGASFFWQLQAKTWDQAVFTALSVLVIACPCALGFATPLAIWIGIARLRELGILARSGEAVEKLAEIDTVVFDKTGTLTLPEQYGVSWRVAGAWCSRERELSGMLREAELASRHPLAKILSPLWIDGLPQLEFAGLRGVRLLPGAGIVAEFQDGRELFAGMEDRASGSLVVNVDHELAATIDLKETQASAVSPAVQALEAMGIDVVLATGDAAERAAEIPVKTRMSRQSPADKQALLRDLASQGRKVLFAGDGLNDTAAMAWSHVACAAPESAELVRDLSGLVFLHRDWIQLAKAIRIARKVRQVVRWNIGFSLAYNLIGMAFAALGWLHPVAAALMMTASSLTVIIYSMHLADWEN